MKYLTYSGNDLLRADLPDSSTVYYPTPARPGIPRKEWPAAVRRTFEAPLGMEPLQKLVNSDSRILVAFDDNCQPFPRMRRPDFREIAITTLLEMLDSYGVDRRNVQLMCAVALHRKMKPHELEYMLGKKLVAEFAPDRLRNFDAEDPDDIVRVGETEAGEPVETTRAVAESDLVIYIDTIQIPLNGGHKSVAVGFGTYNSIAPHHAPQMTADSPHVMQPEGSHMHASIERISRVILEHHRVIVLEAPMNGETYPAHLRYLAKPPSRSNIAERLMQSVSPPALSLLPESGRRAIFRSLKTEYLPLEINAGDIDAVHHRTLGALKGQLEIKAPRQFSTLVFGLPDLSPYSIDARVNPVLVVSDVLGYIFNWFYKQPFIRPGGVVIILNPVYEVFHPEYHVAYQRFWDEVLPETAEPFEMHERFQDAFAQDPHLVECYRNRWAHHGFHPFTVWYWATFPLKYLSRVILVGPQDDRQAKRLGVHWAPSLEHALGQAREITGDSDIVAPTIPPFLYLSVES